MTLLPVEPAWRLAERAEEHRWLVTGLWSEQAVGIVGGEPKCCKSFLALDLAVAVASGTPCLRRFAVSRAGRVLLFAAEDALHIVRRRLEGINACAARFARAVGRGRATRSERRLAGILLGAAASEAMRQDLKRLSNTWEDAQTRRRR
jgi:hypothetical protein